MKRFFAMIVIAAFFSFGTTSDAQIQQSGYIATPSTTTSILGQVVVAMTNATCNVTTPGSNCTVTGPSVTYLNAYVQTYRLTGSLSGPQSLVIPLQPGALHCIGNETGQTITVGGVSGTTVAVTTGPPQCIVSTDGINYVAQGSASAITALTGDGTATGPGSVPLTLATVNGSPGSCGDATHVGQVTVNGKGLTTACTPVAITGVPASTVPFSGITSGTNTGATMTVGSGASMGPSGTGTIYANQSATRIPIEKYSGVGDGVYSNSSPTGTDNTTPLQNALNALTPGQCVSLQPKIYRITASITWPSTANIGICGPTNSTWNVSQGLSGVPAIMFTGTPATAFIINGGSSGTQILAPSLTDFAILYTTQPTGASTAAGIKATYTNQLTTRNINCNDINLCVWVQASPNYFVYGTAYYASVANTTITASSYDGTYTNCGILVDSQTLGPENGNMSFATSIPLSPSHAAIIRSTCLIGTNINDADISASTNNGTNSVYINFTGSAGHAADDIHIHNVVSQGAGSSLAAAVSVNNVTVGANGMISILDTWCTGSNCFEVTGTTGTVLISGVQAATNGTALVCTNSSGVVMQGAIITGGSAAILSGCSGVTLQDSTLYGVSLTTGISFTNTSVKNIVQGYTFNGTMGTAISGDSTSINNSLVSATFLGASITRRCSVNMNCPSVNGWAVNSDGYGFYSEMGSSTSQVPNWLTYYKNASTNVAHSLWSIGQVSGFGAAGAALTLPTNGCLGFGNQASNLPVSSSWVADTCLYRSAAGRVGSFAPTASLAPNAGFDAADYQTYVSGTATSKFSANLLGLGTTSPICAGTGCGGGTFSALNYPTLWLKATSAPANETQMRILYRSDNPAQGCGGASVGTHGVFEIQFTNDVPSNEQDAICVSRNLQTITRIGLMGATYFGSSGQANISATGVASLPSLALNGGTAMTANQGTGTSLQHSTGSTTTNNCVKFDSTGNTVDAGAACGTGSGTISSGTTNILPKYTAGTTIGNSEVKDDGTNLTYNNTRLIVNESTGNTTILGNLSVAAAALKFGTVSAAAWGTSGTGLSFANTTYTDTSSSGTVAQNAVYSISAPTLAASSSTTYTNAETFYIGGAPGAGSNVTITTPWSLYVASGNSFFSGTVAMAGGSTVGNSAICTANGTNCPNTGVSASWSAGSGVTSVSCLNADDVAVTCTSARGSLKIVGGTATTGTIATGTWTSEGASRFCSVTQNGAVTTGTASFDLGHGSPGNTGFNITAGLTVIGATIYLDYQCQL